MLVVSVALIFVLIFFIIKYIYSYWQRHGFPNITPTIPLGNLVPVATRQMSFGMNIYELHRSSIEPFVGIYLLFKPALLIRDADLIKNILLNDFNCFRDRGVYCNPKYDPLSENLFAMPSTRWKKLRAILSQSFTSSKILNMMPKILDEGSRMQNFLENDADMGNIVEIKDLVSRYTLNVIASVIFGIEVDTITDPNNRFRTIEKDINNPSLRNVLYGVGVFLCPKILEIIRASSIPPPVKEFMIGIVRQTIEYREKNNISQKDFMQFLIKLRNTANTNDNQENLNNTSASNDGNNIQMSIETCAAQVFLFYVAGFETSASTISYGIYELARSPDKMQLVQQEIDTALKKYGNQLTWDCIKEMHYLELCIMETMRKYPALPILNRECTETYQLPNSSLTIQKGTSIIISLMGIMRDPKYFPEPEKFLPERFSEENQNYYSDAYIPFGDGPRSCLGVRLGKLITKIGLIKLLQRYDFAVLNDKEIEFDNYAVVLVPKGGVKVKVTQRNIQ